MQNKNKTEKALHQSEERYLFMFENNPQPMFIYDLETLAFLQVNKAFIEQYGYSKEEFLSMTLKDIHLPEDLDKLMLDVEKTRCSDNPSGEWVNVKKNGDLIYTEIVAQTVVFNNRTARHILTNDITKRRQTENALRASEEQFRLLFNISPDALFLIDENGKFIDANHVAINRYGYSHNEFTTMTPKELAAPEFKEKVIQQLQSATLVEIHFEWIHCTKDGYIFPVEIHSKPIVIQEKKCLFVEVRDISERKQTETKLVESANQWQTTFDTVKDGICLLNSNQQIVRCNKVMYEMFPNCNTSMIGKHCWEVIHGIQEPLHECPIIKMKKTLKRESIELKVNDRWLDITVDPIFDNNNSYAGAVHIVRNITERKLAAESLTQLNDKLTDLNITKNKLFTIIAHDLKSPFNSILGFSDLLLNNLHSHKIEKMEEFIKQINYSAKNTLSLIDNLWAWANSQMGQINYQPDNLLLLPLIQDIIEFLSPTAKIKNITIRYFQSDEIAVYADKNLLQIIIRNLISNAIKFTKPNGKINVYSIQNQDQIIITISDNGVGITKENLIKLFDIHNSFTTSGTTLEKGSGLGLILCKEFVEKHGGKIWVESEIDIGSEFNFTLPKNLTAN